MNWGTGEHDDGGFRELEAIDEEVAHALGVVDAPFELTGGVAVGDPTDNRPLAPVGRWRGATWRGVVVGGGRGRGRGRGDSKVVSDVGDGLAHRASYRLGAGRELERGPAVGAVDQHEHGGKRCNSNM